jgi:hypothetical protein
LVVAEVIVAVRRTEVQENRKPTAIKTATENRAKCVAKST